VTQREVGIHWSSPVWENSINPETTTLRHTRDDAPELSDTHRSSSSHQGVAEELVGLAILGMSGGL